MRGEVRLDLGSDLVRVGVDAVDEEAEIGGGEGRVLVREILCGEKIANVECVEERFHGATVVLECGGFSLDLIVDFFSFWNPTTLIKTLWMSHSIYKIFTRSIIHKLSFRMQDF